MLFSCLTDNFQVLTVNKNMCDSHINKEIIQLIMHKKNNIYNKKLKMSALCYVLLFDIYSKKPQGFYEYKQSKKK